MKLQACFDNFGTNEDWYYYLDVYNGTSLVATLPERNCNGPTTDACATAVQFEFSGNTTLRLHQRGWTAIQIWEVEITYATSMPTQQPIALSTPDPTMDPTMEPTMAPTANPSKPPTAGKLHNVSKSFTAQKKHEFNFLKA